MSVGSSELRVDALAKVTGRAEYPGDRSREGDLVAKVVFTNQPHARLRLLDVGKAKATPGVLAVLTSSDVPVNEYGLTMRDQPVFIGIENSGRSRVPSNISRWEADHLALVVGESRDAVAIGAEAIVADWEELPIIENIDEALAFDAPLLHSENELATNVYQNYKIRKGNFL